jgi:hypothetical protein
VSRASDGAEQHLRKLSGAACGSPLFISRTPQSRLRPPDPQHQER